MDFRKISNVSVDCVIIGLDDSGLNVLLLKRSLQMYDEQYPVIDDWVLTGEHVYKSERLDESAKRIFKKYTGITTSYKKQFVALGNPDRIKNEKDVLWIKSRGSDLRTIAVAYYFLLRVEDVKLESNDLKWFSVDQLPELGFDHREIIARACDDLKQSVMLQPVIFELLPEKFTLNELQVAYQSVLNVEIDNRNFRKKAIATKYIIPLNEKRIGVSKKPASLFIFSKDVYDKIGKKSYIINI